MLGALPSGILTQVFKKGGQLKPKIGGGNFPIFWKFSPRNLGKMGTHFDEHIFQRGWFNHQLENEKLPTQKGKQPNKNQSSSVVEIHEFSGAKCQT